MNRQAWRDFICDPERAGRHLSSIGKSVIGALSEPIDHAALQSFLEKLRENADDVRLLAGVIDLITGGYTAFSKGPLQTIIDALSNEMLSKEQIVGPGLRGNPRWDRTLVQRMAGKLSPVHYVSRTSHRSFELPENQLLAWLIDNLRKAVTSIEQRVGTAALHSVLAELRDACELVQHHHWFGEIVPPLRLTPQMINAASRHRRSEYRCAAKLAMRRLELETDDRAAWWYSVLSLLAVNWLEPISDDDLFELYGLVMIIDLLAHELGLGEPVEYGLVTSRRSHVALFQAKQYQVRVYFDQTPAAILNIPTEYGLVVDYHGGLSGGERRPDVLVIAESEKSCRIALIEMKKTKDGRYLSDSVYKVFGYLYDFQHSLPRDSLRALLLVPTGVSATPEAPSDRVLFIVSGDDRAAMAQALRCSLLN